MQRLQICVRDKRTKYRICLSLENIDLQSVCPRHTDKYQTLSYNQIQQDHRPNHHICTHIKDKLHVLYAFRGHWRYGIPYKGINIPPGCTTKNECILYTVYKPTNRINKAFLILCTCEKNKCVIMSAVGGHAIDYTQTLLNKGCIAFAQEGIVLSIGQ